MFAELRIVVINIVNGCYRLIALIVVRELDFYCVEWWHLIINTTRCYNSTQESLSFYLVVYYKLQSLLVRFGIYVKDSIVDYCRILVYVESIWHTLKLH